MSSPITELKIKNFRSLAELSISLGPLTLLFGPNGAGKSSLMDTLWFLRDCANRGVDYASSERSHGIGLLYDGVSDGELISITLATEYAEFTVELGLSSGRIEAFPGERLYSRIKNISLIDRRVGSDSASFYHDKSGTSAETKLRDPEKLSLALYLLFEDALEEAVGVDRMLRRIHFYNSRAFNMHRIRKLGSEVGIGRDIWLSQHCDNLWVVLRNLHDRQNIDERYNTIMRFMRKAFPSFDGVLIEQTGPSVVYGSFLDRNRQEPILASGVSDGHLQMLILLTALFSEGATQESIILLDEPDTSLHPWSIAVLAEALKLATSQWQKQVLVATHSPVLLSQFEADSAMAAELVDGRTRLTKLSEIEGIQDLLEEYATGSLYMANMVAPQGAVAMMGETA